MSLFRPLTDTARASIRLSRERARSLGWQRLLVAWFLQALMLVIVAAVVPGVQIQNAAVALLAALVIGLLNALVRPILIVLTLPLTVLTAGFLSLIINAVVLVLAVQVTPGFDIDSFASAIAAAILITVLGTLLSVVLSSNEDDSFYAELTRRMAGADRVHVPGAKGLIVIQIDGLAAPILRNAIRVGLTPNMSRWVRSGTYRLIEWECQPPSQTSASQAGILHGNNDDIPAFRWYEKESGKLMVSNHPADATEIERRVSDGKGLLAAGGMSASNLFSGDAARTLFTMSRVRSPTKAADVDAFSLFFVDPSAFIRTIILTIGELGREWTEARRQIALDIQPRVHRGRSFAVLRALTNVLMRDLNVTFVMNAVGKGAPIMYVDFVDYDEVAHHAGPERLESLRSLTGVDGALASIERAVAEAPRDYSIVVLSDHGQSQGPTFLQRFGLTLDKLVRDLMGGATSLSMDAKDDGSAPVTAMLANLGRRRGMAARATASALSAAAPNSDPDAAELEVSGESKAAAAPEVVVGVSGNLANVYFLAEKRRLTLEEIQQLYPGLVEGLATHPGIGFLLVRSGTLGPLAIGGRGVHHLATGEIEGVDPLALFGEHAANHLLRLDGFEHVGDLLVNSAIEPDLEEVYSFEELVGSHGGFGGPQVRPFVLAPSEFAYDGKPIIGAPQVHKLLVQWADSLGVGPESGATDAPLADQGPIRNPRGIGAIALLTTLTSLVWGLAGVLFLFVGIDLGGDDLDVAGFILLTLGIVGLVISHGLWRRRSWARIVALAWYGLGVLQALAALGSGGVSGLLSAGLVTVAVTLLVFYYLTRPYVAAAFSGGSAQS